MLKKKTTTRMRSMGTGQAKENARSEFPVSSAHESIKSARKRVREDLELRWVTNLSEERKRFYLIATLLDPRTKMLSFCDKQILPLILERRGSRISFNGVSKFLYGAYSRRSQSCGWTSP